MEEAVQTYQNIVSALWPLVLLAAICVLVRCGQRRERWHERVTRERGWSPLRGRPKDRRPDGGYDFIGDTGGHGMDCGGGGCGE